jgi:hypothetical protein
LPRPDIVGGDWGEKAREDLESAVEVVGADCGFGAGFIGGSGGGFGRGNFGLELERGGRVSILADWIWMVVTGGDPWEVEWQAFDLGWMVVDLKLRSARIGDVATVVSV